MAHLKQDSQAEQDRGLIAAFSRSDHVPAVSRGPHDASFFFVCVCVEGHTEDGHGIISSRIMGPSKVLI